MRVGGGLLYLLASSAVLSGGCCTTGTTTELHVPSCTREVTIDGRARSSGKHVFVLEHGGDAPMTTTVVEMTGLPDEERIELVNNTPNGVMVLAGGAAAVVGAAMVGGGLWLFPDGQPSVPLLAVGAAGVLGGALLLLSDWHPAERVVHLPDHCGAS
jgi:hypothetical protein